MDVQIPVIAEKPLPTCGCRKFQIDALGDHLCTCTAHSGAKKAHNLLNFSTQRQRLIELAGYLTNATVPGPLVMNLRITHDRVGSSTDPRLCERSWLSVN